MIGVPHERWVERPLACVVVEPGETLTSEELRAHLEPLVARWWLPDAVELIDEVPKTSVGKFSKRTLRDKFAGYELPDQDDPGGAEAARCGHPSATTRSLSPFEATAQTVLPSACSVTPHAVVSASTICRPRPRAAVGSIGAGRSTGPGRASRTETHRPSWATPIESVLSVRAWSTAFATSSVITMAASWTRSSSTPHSSVAHRRNARATPGAVGVGGQEQLAVPVARRPGGRSGPARRLCTAVQPGAVRA